MFHDYGQFSCWIEVEKAFGHNLMAAPSDQPLKLWAIAIELIHNDEWARDLIKQFYNLGILDMVEKGNKLSENTYYVNRDQIEEMGWL